MFPSVPLVAFPVVPVEYVVCLRWGTCDGSCREAFKVGCALGTRGGRVGE